MKRLNPATSVVQRAQQTYPKNLKAVANYFGNVPYGQQPVDSRTADKRLLAMPPEELAQMAATDPIRALGAQRRMQTLQDRADSQGPVPGQDTFEG